MTLDATTAVRGLRECVAALHDHTPEQQRVALAGALRDIQSAGPGADDAFAAVLEADRAWRPLAQDISERYRRDPAAAGADPAQFHVQMAEIELLFSDVYAVAPDVEETPLQVTGRTLFHLGNYGKWIACNREPWDAALWRRVHGTFERAVVEGFDASLLALYEDKDTIFTCRQLWLGIVMFGTMNTGSLSPRQIERAEQWLLHWSADIGLDWEYDDSRHLYCVDLAGDGGPVRIGQALDVKTPIYLRTKQLYAEIVAARRRYFEPVSDEDLGAYATNPLREYLHLLDELQRTWTAPPVHQHGRSSRRNDAPPDSRAEVIRGIAEIFALSDPVAAETTRRTEHWSILEHSEGGLGLEGPADGGAPPDNQEVIALRWEDSEDWKLGVIVRVTGSQAQSSFQAGVRLLAHEAILLTLTEIPGLKPPLGAQKDRRVLFLSGNERRGQADSVLCPAGMLVPKMRLSLSTRSHLFVLLIDRVIEGTADWQRIGFQVLEKRAVGAQPAAALLPQRVTVLLPAEKPSEKEVQNAARNKMTTPELIALITAAHPRVGAAIELTWGTIECEKYMDTLIVSDRPSRQGFAEPVMAAILLVYTRHTRDFEFRAKTKPAPFRNEKDAFDFQAHAVEAMKPMAGEPAPDSGIRKRRQPPQ